jgi:hypothetical protein
MVVWLIVKGCEALPSFMEDSKVRGETAFGRYCMRGWKALDSRQDAAAASGTFGTRKPTISSGRDDCPMSVFWRFILLHSLIAQHSTAVCT